MPCHAIREDTGLIGDDVAELADGAWLLGELARNGQTVRSVVLALRLQDRDAADLLFRIKTELRLDVVVVTTTLSTPLRQQFLTADIPWFASRTHWPRMIPPRRFPWTRNALPCRHGCPARGW
jgi:hypothetical protein